MHETVVIAWPKAVWAIIAVVCLVVGEALAPGRPRSLAKLLGELLITTGLVIGGWHFGLYRQLDPDLQVAIAVFSAWGFLRSGQWTLTGMLKLAEIAAKTPK